MNIRNNIETTRVVNSKINLSILNYVLICMDWEVLKRARIPETPPPWDRLCLMFVSSPD